MLTRKAPLRASTTATLRVRLKRCKHCRQGFAPAASFQTHCRAEACAVAALQAVQDKRAKAKAKEKAAEKKQDRAKLAALKSRATLIREAQTAVNAWIRLRDADKPCVSCGRWHEGQWHAGHFQSTGARPDLRFDEANIHKQCQPCNTHLSGNLIHYRAELVRRIGLAEVERLEGPASPDKLSREDIIALRKTYAAKAKQLKEAA